MTILIIIIIITWNKILFRLTPGALAVLLLYEGQAGHKNILFLQCDASHDDNDGDDDHDVGDDGDGGDDEGDDTPLN